MESQNFRNNKKLKQAIGWTDGKDSQFPVPPEESVGPQAESVYKKERYLMGCEWHTC